MTRAKKVGPSLICRRRRRRRCRRRCCLFGGNFFLVLFSKKVQKEFSSSEKFGNFVAEKKPPIIVDFDFGPCREVTQHRGSPLASHPTGLGSNINSP